MPNKWTNYETKVRKLNETTKQCKYTANVNSHAWNGRISLSEENTNGVRQNQKKKLSENCVTNTWWLVFMVAPECIRCHFRKSLKISSIVKATDRLIPYWLVNCAWLYTISFTSNTVHASTGGYDNKIHVRWWWLHPIISMTKYKWDITLNINIYISIYAYAVRDVYVNSETHYTKTHNNYLNYYQFSVMKMYIWRIEGNEHFASAERKLNDPLNKQRDMVLCFCLPRNGCEYSTNNNMSTFCFGRLN